MGEQVAWDYSELAASYDRRAEYADAAINWIVTTSGVKPGDRVADLGAGTAKLAKRLAALELTVHAVEPNDNMRSHGETNTAGMPVKWSEGTGERTRLDANTYPLVTFGSSFNVTDRGLAMAETCRILTSGGWMACLWNHRDLEDDLQSEIEGVIKASIPGYDYGNRRQDQAPILRESGLFSSIHQERFRFSVPMDSTACVDAWRSHGTLQRQAADQFGAIIERIERVVLSRGSTIEVPYHTAVWMARKSA